MNNFDKQLELSTTKTASPPLWSKSKTKTRRWIENDSAIVVFLILGGLLGLYYIPKSAFANSASNPISDILSHTAPTSSSSSVPSPAHTFNASALINGTLEVGATVKFSIDTPQAGWNYFLTIEDAAPIRIKAPFTSYTFTEAGAHSLELIAKRAGAFELLEVKAIVIAPSLIPTTASSQQKLTPF